MAGLVYVVPCFVCFVGYLVFVPTVGFCCLDVWSLLLFDFGFWY